MVSRHMPLVDFDDAPFLVIWETTQACDLAYRHCRASPQTVDLFRERNTRSSRRIPHDLWRIVQRKLKALDVAARLEDLRVPSGNRLERLKGRRAGRYSLRVNEQCRVTCRWESGHAYEVRVEDYH